MQKLAASLCAAVQISFMAGFGIPCEASSKRWSAPDQVYSAEKVPAHVTVNTIKRDNLLIQPRQQINNMNENSRIRSYLNRYFDAAYHDEIIQRSLHSGQMGDNRYITMPVIIW